MCRNMKRNERNRIGREGKKRGSRERNVIGRKREEINEREQKGKALKILIF